jgi:hypothetical protein
VFWAGPDRLEPPSAAEGDFYRHAVLDGSRKLVRQTQGTEAAPLLFDLAADPGESVDLAPANSEAVAALERAHRSWSMAESRLPATLRHVSGAASIRSAWLRLAGGELQLATDGRATVHDGDMTFFAIVTPEWLVGEQVIAEQEGSWRLALGETGTLSLRVEGADGIAAEIESGARLAPGVSTEVAFTLFGWPRANSELRLYVDGQLEAQSRALSSMAAGEAWLRLGSSADGALPFHGMLWGPRLHLMSLPPAELVDIDQDGIANGDDACIGVADTAQRDSDSDGIGDACDADLDGDGIVGTADRVLLYKAFGSRAGQPGYEARCDFDGDGVVGLIDRALLEKSFGAPPGPSGRVCTPLDPCPAH